MFVYNLKVNGNKIFKAFFIIVAIIIICISCIIIYRIFNGASNASTCIQKNQVCKIEAKNYTNVLKAVHDNIDDYIDVKIHFIGYVYRVSDLTDNQFILARNMIVSSDYQSVVVGFLSEHENAKEFENNSWIEVTGEITKGDYHGVMPILKITDIKEVDKPNEEFVYPPDDSYIPTSGLL